VPLTRLAPAAFLLLAACEPAAGTQEVSRAEFERGGLTWPFTVDRGQLACDRIGPNDSGGSAVTFTTPAGATYALNGSARTRHEYADPILVADAAMMRSLRAAGDTDPYVVRIDPRDARAEGLKLCA
jgi:hypothetical protein